jgi:hypothetical protein
MTSIVARDALYYPYIMIRDVNWLKITLLCFPQVRRMIPNDSFALYDKPDIWPFVNAIGLHGPMLMAQPITTEVVLSAQFRLIRKLQENEPFIKETYGHARVMQEYEGIDNICTVHGDKFSLELLTYLQEHALAWRTPEPYRRPLSQPMYNDPGRYPWFGVHPALGEAFMSVVAIALAKDSTGPGRGGTSTDQNTKTISCLACQTREPPF